MFLRKVIEKFRRDRLEELNEEVKALHEEVKALRGEIDTLKSERNVYVNEDGERVPMAQVLNEYLYGKEEGE